MRHLKFRGGRSRSAGDADSGAGSGGGARILVVGLGNPGARYDGTPHNIGFRVAARLADEWQLPRAKEKFRGRIAEGRTMPGGPRVVLLTPTTFMNESGKSAGPARGSLGIPLDRVVALHDEIDLPFGEVRVKFGGGAAGHNGLKSLRNGFGSNDYWRVRIGVGRPDSTDPERVAGYVLGRFRQPAAEVEELVDIAAAAARRLVEDIARPKPAAPAAGQDASARTGDEDDRRR